MKKYMKPILTIEEYNLSKNLALELSSPVVKVFDTEDNVLNDTNMYQWEW